MATIGNYGRYNATVKTVIEAAEQENGGYHFSAMDLHTLRLAILDLQGILDNYKDMQGVSLRNDDGTYSPTVLVLDYGRNYLAYTLVSESLEDQRAAEDMAMDAIDNGAYLGDAWKSYSNAPAILDYYKAHGFSVGGE